MVEWHDLLSIPWKLHGEDRSGMDCSTLAEEVLRRSGVTPPATSPHRLPTSAGEWGEMPDYFTHVGGAFDRLGGDASDAKEVGDLVLARDEKGVARHLYVLVEPSRGTFLTATHDHGVTSIRRYMIRNVSGVYRLREQGE